VRLKVDQRDDQLSLPHFGITKQNKIEQKLSLQGRGNDFKGEEQHFERISYAYI